MNRRILIIGAAVVGVALVVVLVVLALRGKKSGTPNVNITTSSNTNHATNTSTANTNSSDTALRQRVVDFSERYESGPSGSENLRLLALQDFLTPNLVLFAEAQARRGATKSAGTVVAGKALTIKMTNQTSTKATATVDVQRTATNPSNPTIKPAVTYITVRLELQKIGSDWKVAAVTEQATQQL